MEKQQLIAGNIELISLNICNQLIAFQQSIAQREEGQRFPTPQELNVQCKHINCLDKMGKYLAKMQAKKAVTGFLTFIGRQDKALSKKLLQQYAEYAAEGETQEPLSETQQNKQEQPQPAQESPNLTGQVEQDAFLQALAAANEPGSGQSVANQEPAPVTEQDFTDYRNLIGEFKNSPNNTQVNFRGAMVSAKWLEYNLFQYTLPPSERRFINDVTEATTEANKRAFFEKTERYFYELVNVAA